MPSASGIRAGKAFVELGVRDQLTAGLKQAQRQLKAFGDGVRALGQRLVTASLAAAAPLAISTTIFAGFEQRMARVRALTGAAGADFDRLSSEAKRLGEATIYSASQAADAMSFFALAGFNVAQILKATDPTLNLAAAGQLEIAQAADIAAKIMAGMGIEADHLGHAVDVLTKAMTTANTDLLQLGDAMKFVGPIAKSAGLEFEETVAAIQLLSNAGIQGEMAGTTLRGAILALTSPSQEAADKLHELGVQVLDAQGNVRPLADIVAQLNHALDGLGTGQKLDILGRLFPARTAAGMAELLSQGADRLRQFTAALHASAGVAARIANVQLNTLQGEVVILTSALEGLAIAVGAALAGPLRIVANSATQFTGQLAAWVKNHQGLVTLVAASVLGLGALGATLVAVGVAAQGAAFVLGGLATVVGAVHVAFAVLPAVIAAVASPIGVVVAAVAGLGAALVYLTDSGTAGLKWLRETFDWLAGGVSAVMDSIREALVAGDVSAAAKVLWAGLRVAWEQGTRPLQEAWAQVAYGFQSAAIEAFHGVEVAWIRVRDFLEKDFPELTAFMARVWADFNARMKSGASSVHRWVTDRWLEMMGLFDDTLDVATAKAVGAQQLAEDLADIAADKQGQLDEINRRAARTPAEREAEQNAALHQAEQDRAAAIARLATARDHHVAQAEAELRAAEEALLAAQIDAFTAQVRAQNARPGAPGAPAGLPPGGGALDDQFEGISNRLAVVSAGTFRGADVSQLFAPADQLDERMQTLIEATRRVERAVRDARPRAV